MALIALAVLAVILPLLVFVAQNEAKWTVKQKKTTTAFQMAEAGIERGEWKLNESDSVWNQSLSSTVITGYNFDIVYKSTDSAGRVSGEYKVRLIASSIAGRVLVESMGRDVSADEIRAIEAEYSKSFIETALLSRSVADLKTNFEVHWGPVVNYGSITDVPNFDFPRKVSKSSISGRDTDPNVPNGHNYFSVWPSSPATYDYNSYQTNLGNEPTIDLEAYKTLAKNSSIPGLKKMSNGLAAADPVGSGYYTENVDISLSSGGVILLNCSTCVIYVNGDVDFKDTDSQLQVRALIVTGVFDMNYDPVPDLVAKIPVGAETEYRYGTAPAVWTSNFSATGEGGNYVVTGARVRGYVYVGGEFKNSGGGNPSIIGTLDVKGTVNVNNTRIYYDAAVSTGVLTMNQNPRRTYWREYATNEW
ncbi:MAG: hypothetical protein HY401_05735 [Elusimicrobia bacterium]|nr:hypothetical protein [Elusimicrobiota bacterium]